MKQATVAALLISLSLLLNSCNTTEPSNDDQSINLKLEDASCTEAWISLTTSNLQLPAELTLKKSTESGSTSQILNLNTQDSLLYIDSLLPNQTYVFQSIIHPISQSEVKSSELGVTTMDTTSHNFTFETFTFGDISNSVLFDVAIINENNIWAVGKINSADTSINGYTTYNAVHWDGTSWNLQQVMFYTICGQQSRTAYPASSVFAFSESEIWIAMRGDQITKIENGVQTQTVCSPWSFTINKIWGSNSNDLYIVGNNGNIAHYQNWQWSKITSGTDVDLKDIYGTKDGKTIWISGYEDFKPTVLLKISNSIIETVFNSRDYLFVNSPDHISGGIVSVWTNNNNFVYITTWYGLYRKSIYLDPSREEFLPPSGRGRPSSEDWYGIRSRATDINNIFTSGNRGTLHHFNGVTYRTYQELADNGLTYYSLDFKSNVAVLCGQKYENGISDKAIITLIKK